MIINNNENSGYIIAIKSITAEHRKNTPHTPVNILFVSRNARVLQIAFGSPCLEYSAVNENVLVSEINHKPPKKILENILR